MRISERLLWRLCKIMCWNDRSQDTLVPSLLNLLPVFNSQILNYMPRWYLKHFNELVLKDKHASGNQVYLKNHLVSHSIDILWVYFQRPVENPLRKGDHIGTLVQGILIIFECWNIHMGFSLAEGLLGVFFIQVVKWVIVVLWFFFSLVIARMNYNCWRGYYWSMLIYLLTFDANIFKHFGEVAFTIGAFLTRKD